MGSRVTILYYIYYLYYIYETRDDSTSQGAMLYVCLYGIEMWGLEEAAFCLCMLALIYICSIGSGNDSLHGLFFFWLEIILGEMRDVLKTSTKLKNSAQYVVLNIHKYMLNQPHTPYIRCN